jgi:hypothetical protein
MATYVIGNICDATDPLPCMQLYFMHAVSTLPVAVVLAAAAAAAAGDTSTVGQNFG